MRNWINLFLTVTVIAFTIVSCSSDDNPTEPIQMELNGYIQKGPFISGTSLTIQELTDSFVSNGTTYSTTINNDFGGFSLSSEISSNYVEVIANGYYFDEVSGQLSSSELTLRSVLDVNESDSTNVNILTTLSKDRIIHLVIEENLDFEVAKSQAEIEILQIFGIYETDLASFENMNISENSVSNAILLAISATLQCDNTVAELSELISKINLDIKEDGTLNDQICIDEIRNNGKQIVFTEVRNNIEERYTNLGLSVNIPFFEDYLDSDGDGIINKNDNDTFIWIRTLESAPWATRMLHSSITFQDKVWIIGGRTDESIPGVYQGMATDIWNTVDGVNWTQISNNIEPLQQWFTCVVFLDKIWIFTKATDFDTAITTNDIWNSQDGIVWNKVGTAPDLFYSKVKSIVYDNKLWLIEDNSVWNSEDGINWTNVTSSTIWNDLWGSHYVTVFNNKMWLTIQKSVWSSTDGINWIQEQNNAPWPNRYEAQTFTSNDSSLYLISGYSAVGDGVSEPLNDAWYSSDGINWNEIQDVPFPIRGYHSSVIYDNKLWVIAGANGINNTFLNDVWCFQNYADWVISLKKK